MTEQQREAFEQWYKTCLDRDKELCLGDKELCRHAWQAALSHAEGEAGPVATKLHQDPYDERDGFYASAEDWERLRALPPGTMLYTHPAPQVAVPEQREWNQAAGRDDLKYTEGWNACRDAVLAAPTTPQAAVPDGWTDRHTRITRFALWRLISEGYHRARVAAQKGQPGTADDAAALLDDVKRAEEARGMLAVLTAPAPTKGEEIHVNVDGVSVYTLPLEPTGMAAPRFVVHVPAPDEREIAAQALDDFKSDVAGWVRLLSDSDPEARVLRKVNEWLHSRAKRLRAGKEGEPGCCRSQPCKRPGAGPCDLPAAHKPVSDADEREIAVIRQLSETARNSDYEVEVMHDDYENITRFETDIAEHIADWLDKQAEDRLRAGKEGKDHA